MNYSSIHNLDLDRKYDIYLNGDLWIRKVPSHHVDSVVYELESNGLNVVDEIWDEEALKVDLVSSAILDEDIED